MAISVSSDIKESNISFNGNSLISNGSTWSIDRGSVNIGSIIEMGSHSKCSTNIENIRSKNLKCTYLKLLAHITCSDETLSTETTHNVTVCYTIEYENDNGIQRIVDCFYPKYDFEDDYINDYSIIAVPCGYIRSLSVSIINNEDVEVDITNTGLYYCMAVTEETMNTTIINQFDTDLKYEIPSIVEDYLNDYFGGGGGDDGTINLVIPLVQALPNINSVPDGYICRLASMDAR